MGAEVHGADPERLGQRALANRAAGAARTVRPGRKTRGAPNCSCAHDRESSRQRQEMGVLPG
jgi:hypothetical protein